MQISELIKERASHIIPNLLEMSSRDIRHLNLSGAGMKVPLSRALAAEAARKTLKGKIRGHALGSLAQVGLNVAAHHATKKATKEMDKRDFEPGRESSDVHKPKVPTSKSEKEAPAMALHRRDGVNPPPKKRAAQQRAAKTEDSPSKKVKDKLRSK